MIRFLVHHATTVFLAVLCVFVFGLGSYISLPRESSPDIKIPVVVVTTPYVGASPSDVEGLVTIPLENELASLTDVKEMRSSSAEGVSVVTIEFEPEIDIDDALQKVRDRVSRARGDLPGDVEEPTVREISFSDIPVLLITISGDGVDEQVLKKLGEALEDEVKRVPGVLDAEVTGGREREIHVDVDPARIGHYGLALYDVTDAIAAENVNIPGGEITTGRATFLLRTPGEFTDPAQVERVAVKRVGDRPVFVRDLAIVRDEFEDRKTYSRMESRPSVTVSIKKRTGANILEVAQTLKDTVAKRSETWPAGVTYRVLGDQSENIENMVLELQNNIITALILVVGVLLLFMGARNSLFVGLAIPLSMFLSFLVLDALGFTLNMVVLFSLILALGMLVDNGIVVVENIYRHAEMGKDLKEAAIDGTNEVAIAVLASTLTTIAAFFPMVFWTGIMGQFMGFLPKTVIIVLTSSYVVAVGVLPVLTSRLMRVPPHGQAASYEDDDQRPLDPATLGPVMRTYHAALDRALGYRYLTLAGGFAVLIGSLVAYGALNHGMEFFPATDPDRATVSVRLPEGADLESTDQVVRAIEAVLGGEKNVETFVAEVGVAGGGNALAGSSQAANAARVTVDFLPAPDKAKPGDALRIEPTPLTMFKLRTAFAAIPGAEITVEPEEMGPPVGDAIAVQVSGDDFDRVGEAAAALMRQLAEIPGVTELASDYRVGRPEMRLRVDRGAAKRVGVTTQAVGGALRTAVAGTEASVLREGEDEHDIVVRIDPASLRDIQQVLTLRVPGREDTSPQTFPVPISAVATYELAGGAGTIQHVDQDLVVTITGDVTNADEEAAVRGQVAAFLKTWDAPPGISATMGGAADEEADAAAFLQWAFGLAVALILLVLVAQFDSLVMPAIIAFTVLLSLVGVLWGLILTVTPFGLIMTGIGVISLAGIVVNNAIVLLDYVEQLERRGLARRDALLRAGVTRFRPVMLTAITTALGLIPMAIGVSVDFFKFTVITGSSSAQFWGPMAIAVIFGLSFATVLTLVMVPTLYAVVDDAQRWFAARLAPRSVAAAAKVLALGVGVSLAAAPAQAATLEEVWSASERGNVQLRLAEEQTIQAATLRFQALSAVMPRLSVGATYVINQNEFALDFSETFQDLEFPVPEFNTDALPGFLQGLGPALEDAITIPEFEFPAQEPVIVQPKNAWNANLTLYQPLISGQAFPAWMSAVRQYKAAQAQEDRSRQQIRLGVARVFYALAMSRKAVVVSERALEIAKHQLDLATRRVDAGLEDRRSVLRGELSVSRAERDLLAARAQQVDAEQAFARQTGMSADTPLELPEDLSAPMSVDQALSTMSGRGDLRAGEHRIVAVQKERTARDLEWMPTVDFSFTEIYNQVPGFIDANWQWRIAFDFNWTLWDGGLRIARSRQLKSQVRSAQLQLEDARRQAEQEVRTSWEQLQRASTAYEAVEYEVGLAKENLELAERGYEAGTVTWLDVELARLSLENAVLAQLQERMNRDLAVLEVQLAAGTL